MAKNLVKLNINGTDYDQRPYAVCATLRDNNTKQVTISDFTLVDGATIIVKFTNGFNGQRQTLQLNNGATKTIFVNSANPLILSTDEVIMELKYDASLNNNSGGWIVLNTNVLAQADWTNDDARSPQFIHNKPELATVAITGSYNNLSDTPDIPQGTVTSITPGTGLTGTSNDEAITESGTINLKPATADEIGGIKTYKNNIVSVNADVSAITNAVTRKGIGYCGVELDSNNNAFVYVPTASETKLGLIKVGDGLNITEDGTLSATSTTYNIASADTLGVIKVGSNLNITEDGTLSVATASSTVLGGIKVGTGLNISSGVLSVAPNVSTTTNAVYPVLFKGVANATATSSPNRFNPYITINPSTRTLNVGASSGTSNLGRVNAGNGFYETSDERLKDFSVDIDCDLDRLSKLPKKYFRWKDSDDKNLHIGTSAQAVQKIYPELVSADENGTLSVAYDKLSVVALKGIDILNDKIKSLEERIERLEKLIER